MENFQVIMDFIAYAIAIASGITALTPTPKSDSFLGRLYKLIELVGLVVLRAKQKR